MMQWHLKVWSQVVQRSLGRMDVQWGLGRMGVQWGLGRMGVQRQGSVVTDRSPMGHNHT